MKKILVGMSGGVDSSVAALLLKQQGYDVCGCTLKLFEREDEDECGVRTCCSLSDVEDARRVCHKLGIEHYVFNFKDLFMQEVMDAFAQSYINGETPNPCIECNRHIKFDKMLKRAEEMGYDGIATGHYAKIEFSEGRGRYLLVRPEDRKKDQTYVLYNMTQYQLARTLFPLWGTDKPENRRLAEENGLINARKPDSQDICFVPDGDYAAFIKKHTGKDFKHGNFIDTDGNVIGTHQGIINYTVGQRKGLGVTFGKPVFVCAKNPDDNTVTLGDAQSLMSRELYANDINIISQENLFEPVKCTAKTRYNMTDQPCIAVQEGDRLKVVFDSPQRAVTKGQAVVLYDGDIVIGGGKII